MGGYFLFVVVGSTSFLNPLNSRGLKSELYNISHNSKYPVIFYISYFRGKFTHHCPPPFTLK